MGPDTGENFEEILGSQFQTFNYECTEPILVLDIGLMLTQIAESGISDNGASQFN